MHRQRWVWVRSRTTAHAKLVIFLPHTLVVARALLPFLSFSLSPLPLSPPSLSLPPSLTILPLLSRARALALSCLLPSREV
jgi:hypothetical protein